MKKLGILSLLIVGILSFSACSKGEVSQKDDKGASKTTVESEQKEKKAEDFELEDLEGNVHKLSDYKGKKVLIEFWASWCHVCRDNLPHMDKLFQNTDKDFEVLTVVAPDMFGEKSIDEFKAWFKEQGYTNIKVLVDVEGKLMMSYGVNAFPTNLIIDSNQNVVGLIPGAMSEDRIYKTFESLK